jgi:hypothetical protein
MELTNIKDTIETKIKTLIAELNSSKFSIETTNFQEVDAFNKDLKKTILNYKITFGISIAVISTVVIISLLRYFGIIPVSEKNMPITSALSFIGIVAASFHYKLRKNKLQMIIYLLNLRIDLEKLEKNNS